MFLESPSSKTWENKTIFKVTKNVKFYDGRSSVSILGHVDQDVHGIFVKDSGFNTLAYYAYPDLVIIEMPTDSLPGVISSLTTPDMRLLIEDPELFSNIQSKMKAKKKSSHVRLSWIKMMIMLVAAISFVVLIFKLPYNYAHLIAESIPQSWDDEFGKYAARAITKDYVTCTDSLGQKTLEKLVEGLIEGSGQKTLVTIKVLDDDSTMNAFAMSGNQIFVFSGLIKQSDDYDELAGVLAHEMGHLLKRHPTEGVVHALGLTLFFKIISGGVGQLDYLLNASNLLLTLQYSREHERDADDMAIQILTSTGVGTKGLLSFFNKLHNEEKKALGKLHDTTKGLEGFLSTHPLTEERINHIANLSSKERLPRKRMITKKEWTQIKGMCKRP